MLVLVPLNADIEEQHILIKDHRMIIAVVDRESERDFLPLLLSILPSGNQFSMVRHGINNILEEIKRYMIEEDEYISAVLNL